MSKLPLVCVIMFLAVVIGLTQGPAQEGDPVEKFMQAKLKHSQEVLRGLALEDYDTIAKHSQEMSLLSRAAAWQVIQTPEYRQHSTDFRRTADALTSAAKRKSLDGASLAYVELTLKCIQCHKYVRNVGRAEAEFPALEVESVQARQ